MLRFLLDEHLRGPLRLGILRHNTRGGLPIDVICVGDVPDLPLASADAAILLWAEREDRFLLTQDVHTMPVHLTRHLDAGHHSPGIFVIGSGCAIGSLVGHLELVAHAGEPADYENSITYLP
jgi:hypothetical protein